MSVRRFAAALVVATFALTLAGVASAARPAKADKHDRALVKKLLANPLVGIDAAVEALLSLAELEEKAQSCPAWQAAGEEALGESLLVPMGIILLDRLEPSLLRYQSMIGAMRPHARVFKQWLAMKRREAAIYVTFAQRVDSSRMDLCAFLDAVVAAGNDEEALDMSVVKLFPNAEDLAAMMELGLAADREEATQVALNKRFAAFLRASGYTKAQIAELTE